MPHQQNMYHGGPNGRKQPQVVAVMIPFPAQGHLNQLLQLSRLLLSYHIPVHYVCTATHIRQAKLRVHGWDPLASANIHFHGFEIPPFLSPPPDPNATIKFPSHLQPAFDAFRHLRAPLAGLLRSLSVQSKRVIVIHDSLTGYVIQDVSSIPNAESYTFHSVSAFTIFLFIWEKQGKPIKVSEEFLEDVPSLEGCFSPEFLDFIDFQHRYLNSNSGKIYNTSKVIEGTSIDLLEKTLTGKKHWALGPFNPVQITVEKKAPSNGRNFCLKWLDRQPENSVIYVSFGTTTAMSDEQIKNLAMGLKQSGQKFIWVLRDADKGDVFTREEGRRLPALPKGFEDSVKDVGLVVRDWAPQLEILAHPATGGFVSHCGWNSCLESITMGVPIGTWPMHSDQPRNAVLITKLLKVGIVVRNWEQRDEVVTVAAVENAVKRLMASKESAEVRKRAAELGDAMRRSVADGGVSRAEWDSFIYHITR
ncbi:hypothetical protein SLE2022_135850 [Rubroshorea leprosula]